MRRVPALVLGQTRGNLHRFATVHVPRHPLYRALKPQQMQPANTNGSILERRHERGSHTWRVTTHLSDCVGGTVSLLLGCSTHGRAGNSRLSHQLLAGSGVREPLPLEGDRLYGSEFMEDGDGVREVDPMESTRGRPSMLPVPGEEDNGVVRFILVVVDDLEDGLWGGDGSDTRSVEDGVVFL